jgi:hypothetical protein
LGVFIVPTTKVVVGDGCCRRAHRTVLCATGHCLVRQPRHPSVRVQPLELLTTGALDSPVVHQTVSVHCPVRLLAPALTLRAQFALFTFADERWRASRCSRWHTGQSGATPESPVNYSREPIPETRRWQVWSDSPWRTGHCPVVHRTVRCARPGQPSVFFAPLI